MARLSQGWAAFAFAHKEVPGHKDDDAVARGRLGVASDDLWRRWEDAVRRRCRDFATAATGPNRRLTADAHTHAEKHNMQTSARAQLRAKYMQGV